MTISNIRTGAGRGLRRMGRALVAPTVRAEPQAPMPSHSLLMDPPATGGGRREGRRPMGKAGISAPAWFESIILHEGIIVNALL